MQNPFIVLGISETSTRAQIQDAYRALVKVCHPDIQSTQEDILEGEARLAALNLAYKEALRRTDATTKNPYVLYTLEDTNHLAAKLTSQKMYDSALRVLERCNERNESWYYLHGQVLMNLSRPTPAYESFRKCVRYAPNNNVYRKAALDAYTAIKKGATPVGKAASWLKNVAHR